MINAQVVSPNTLTNTATITPLRPVRPQSPATTPPPPPRPRNRPNLALTKTVSNPTPNVGDTISFTVSFRDTGPNTATNVQVTDMLPAGLTFVSATASQGTYNSSHGRLDCRHGRRGRGPRTLVIQATVVSPSSADELGDDHPLRPVRPEHRQQHGHRHRDPAAGRPRPGQERRQPHPQRGRHDHLHHHAGRQRPRLGDERAGDRSPAVGSHLRVRDSRARARITPSTASGPSAPSTRPRPARCGSRLR